VAAHLYKKNGRWEGTLVIIHIPLSKFGRLICCFMIESISLSKRDKIYKDAIETAATSASTPIAEDLLTYFV
jgi:clathrin heavy chain